MASSCPSLFSLLPFLLLLCPVCPHGQGLAGGGDKAPGQPPARGVGWAWQERQPGRCYLAAVTSPREATPGPGRGKAEARVQTGHRMPMSPRHCLASLLLTTPVGRGWWQQVHTTTSKTKPQVYSLALDKDTLELSQPDGSRLIFKEGLHFSPQS